MDANVIFLDDMYYRELLDWVRYFLKIIRNSKL